MAASTLGPIYVSDQIDTADDNAVDALAIPAGVRINHIQVDSLDSANPVSVSVNGGDSFVELRPQRIATWDGLTITNGTTIKVKNANAGMNITNTRVYAW